MPKIEHMLHHEESLTTVVNNGDALRIHGQDRYRFSPVKVLKNIGPKRLPRHRAYGCE